MSKRQDATGWLSQRQPIFFPRVSEATFGNFPGHFSSVSGDEIKWRFSVSSGVHHSSCCKLQSCKVEGFKATGRDRTVITKGRLSQRQAKDLFF